MSMLEKVARALAFSAGAAFVAPGQCAATREFGWLGDGESLDKYAERHWKEHLHAARFAIAAMGEPSEEEVREFNVLYNLNPSDRDTLRLILKGITEMILSEPSGHATVPVTGSGDH